MINNPSALCFGEMLFDVFGDDRCIGGAPFNFAAHFAQLGGEAGRGPAGEPAAQIGEGVRRRSGDGFGCRR